MENATSLYRPLRTAWKIRHKTLRADQNVFGTKLSLRKSHVHYGWDLEAPENTPVYAVGGPGKVVLARFVADYGRVVMHGFPHQGKVYYAVYAHLAKFTVRVGQEVQAGLLIGYTGISGNADKKDPHLHLEFHDRPTLKRGSAGKVDPVRFFNAPPF